MEHYHFSLTILIAIMASTIVTVLLRNPHHFEARLHAKLTRLATRIGEEVGGLKRRVERSEATIARVDAYIARRIPILTEDTHTALTAAEKIEALKIELAARDEEIRAMIQGAK